MSTSHAKPAASTLELSTKLVNVVEALLAEGCASPAMPAASTLEFLTRLVDVAEVLLAVRRRSPDEIDMLAVEEQLRSAFSDAEQAAVADVLALLDVDVPEIIINGVRHKRALRCEAPYMTSAGEVRIERTLYRAAGERAVAAVDVRAGIVDGWLTPRAAKLACFVVAETTPANAAEMFARIGGMTLSRSSLDRLPKSISGDWEAHRLAYEERLRDEVTVPEEAVTLAVSLDGVMVPMKDGGRVEKRAKARAEGRSPSGPAGYKEVGCGTLTLYNGDGERLMTRRFARMPEPHKRTLKDTLAAEVEAMVARRPSLTVVKVADGASDNWTFLTRLRPEGEEVLDFFHAAEHLSRALAAAYGEASPVYHRQYRRLRRKLREEPDGVERVIRALRYLHNKYPRRKIIMTELAYFRKNRHRMAYASLAARNLPIGSGVVEAACKTLATVRMKRSGMRWRHHGGQAILTLRAWHQSGDFDRAWDLLHQARVGQVELPDNVVPLRARAAPTRASA